MDIYKNLLLSNPRLYAGSTTGLLESVNNLSDVDDIATARANLGFGTIASQDADDVAITGGSITGITDLAVADGGTGASTLTGYVKGAGTNPLTASATIPNTDITGLGTMSTQAASSVAITGGAINGTTIGASTPSTGAFTTASASTSVTTPSVTNAGTLALSATGANILTAATNGVERMRITSGGDVGIGTTTPNMRLVVTGSSAGAGDTGIVGITDGSGANTDTKINFGVVSSSYGWIQALKPGTDTLALTLNPNGGNVGIGTTSPGAKLEVKTVTNGDTSIRLRAAEFGFWDLQCAFINSNPDLNFTPNGGGSAVTFAASGNVGIGTTTPNFSGYGTSNLSVAGVGTIQGVVELVGNRTDGTGSAAGDINFFANSNSAGNKQIAQIQSQTDGATANNRGGNLLFATKANNGAVTERLRIDSSGNVGIGTATPAVKLHTFRNTSDTTASLRVEEDGAGDASMNFLLTGETEYSIGIDNSDGNFFKISATGDLGTNTRLTIDSSGDATFSGALAIGNTVNTVSPTSPNRTVTIVIGGTTYYLHAKTTND